jgi:hypothetical protein
MEGDMEGTGDMEGDMEGKGDMTGTGDMEGDMTGKYTGDMEVGDMELGDMPFVSSVSLSSRSPRFRMRPDNIHGRHESLERKPRKSWRRHETYLIVWACVVERSC